MLRIVKIFHEFNVVHIALVDIEDKLKVRLVHSFIIEYKYIMIGYVQIYDSRRHQIQSMRVDEGSSKFQVSCMITINTYLYCTRKY